MEHVHRGAGRDRVRREGVRAASGLLLLVSLLGLLRPSVAIGQLTNAAPPNKLDVERRTERATRLLLRDRRRDAVYAELIDARPKSALDMLRGVQWLLDEPNDALLRTPEGRFVSSQQAAEEIIRNLTDDEAAVYARIQYVSAEVALKEAFATNSRAGVLRVIRRYWLTPSGGEAAVWLAAEWLDLGECGLAAALYRRLLDEPRHRGLVTGLVQRRAALAARLAGDMQLAAKVAGPDQVPVRPFTGEASPPAPRGIDSAPVVNGSPLQSAAGAEWFGPAPVDQWLPGGNLARIGTVDATAPLSEPLWSQSLVDIEACPNLESWLDQWQAYTQDDNKHLLPCAPNSPVLIGNTVIHRDYTGISARHLQSGALLWRYHSPSSLAQWLTSAGRIRVRRDASGRRQNREFETVNVELDPRRHLALNSSQWQLSSDGRLVFAIEDRPANWTVVDDGIVYSSIHEIINRSVHNRAPQLFSKTASNQLIALQIVPDGVTPNDHVTTGAAADAGGPVESAEAQEASGGQRSTAVTGEGVSGQRQSRPGRARVVWRRSTLPATTGGNQVLLAPAGPRQVDACFLGAPLPGATQLLTIADAQQELFLVALAPHDGSVLWQVPLGANTSPQLPDSDRGRLGAQLAYDQGVAVCGLQNGLVVGVDALLGRPLWWFFEGDLSFDDAPGIRPRGPNNAPLHRAPPIRPAPFGPMVQIHGGQVLVSSLLSDSVYALDLNTGAPTWEYPRLGQEYVVGTTEDRFIAVGRKFVVARRWQDGRVEWIRTLRPEEDGLPVGRGLLSAGQVLLPMDGGKIVRVDVSNGERLPELAPLRPEHIGHLYPHGNIMVTVNARGVAVLPQLAAVERRMSHNPAGLQPLEWLALAELSYSQGDFSRAHQLLERGWQAARGSAAGVQTKLAALWRQVLLHIVRAGATHADFAEALTRLDELSHQPRERAPWIAVRCQQAVTAGDQNSLSELTREVFRYPRDILLTPDSDDARQVAADVFLQEMWSRWDRLWPARAGLPRERFQEWSLARLAGNSFATSESRVEGMRYLDLFATEARDELAAIRFRLAAALATAGERHAAEVLWLRGRRATDPSVAAAAAYALAQFYDQAGLYVEAARELRALATDYAAVDFPLPAPDLDRGPDLLPTNGRDVVAHWPGSGSTREIVDSWEWKHGPGTPVEIVLTSPASVRPSTSAQLIGSRLGLREPSVRYGEYSQRIVPGRESSVEMLITESDPNRLLFFDKLTGATRATHTLQERRHNLPSASHNNFAHAVPLGEPGGWAIYSTLETGDQAPTARIRTAELATRTVAPLMGPTNLDWGVVQSKNTLYVIDPLDGQIRWRRDDLEEAWGLAADLRTGIFGDESVLVVRAVDRVTYKRFSTQTGALLSQGKIDLEQRANEIATRGPLLRGMVRSQERAELVMWDARSERRLVTRNCHREPHLTPPIEPQRTHVAVHMPDSEIQLLSLQDGHTDVKLTLPGGKVPTMGLTVFSDSDRYYVVLPRQQPSVTNSRHHNLFMQDRDLFLPKINIRDEFFAFDRHSGQLLWQGRFPQRSVLVLERLTAPWLIMVSRIRDRQDASLFWHKLEVLDARTGIVLGQRDELPIDHYYHYEVDGERGLVRLLGEQSNVELTVRPQSW